MYKNYLIVAVRNLWKNKSFSFINILGLALGMACSVLILLWVNDEKSVDAFHANGPKLYNVYQRLYFNNKWGATRATQGLLSDELKRVVPNVEYASGFDADETYTFQAGNKIIKEKGAFAGADFFNMFSYPLLQGSAATALNSPVSMAVSRKMANDFFGSAQAAIGKTIRFENRKEFTIAAVFENLPANTSTTFEYVLNWKAYLDEDAWAKQWGNFGPQTFVKLRNSANAATVEKNITHFLDKYPAGQSASYKLQLALQPYSDMYLHGTFKDDKINGGRIEYVNLFSLVAFFILLIACINFMNLTTARSVKRAKEIGIRKVAGAVRSSLIRQFIGEALFLTVISVSIAMFIVASVLPFFNTLTGKQIILPYKSVSAWASLVSLTLITGLISGSYPALFLSSFKPIRVLKGSMKFSSGATIFRKGLVVFQFVLSIVLIIATIVVSKQINYIQQRNIGYDRDNLIYIPLEGDLANKFEVFKNTALKTPGVASISRMGENPTNISSMTFGVDWDGKNPNETASFNQTSVGYDFIKTMKLQLAEGRDFSKAYPSDSLGYILNETAIKRIGYKAPLGRSFNMWGKKGTIIGVVKDFHFATLHKNIEPLVIQLGTEAQEDNVLVRIEAGKTKEALAGLETICRQVNPKYPFSYQFSDEEFGKLYKSDQVIGKLSYGFAFLAIFICCLGLLGLAMFTAEQRTKEIGIRKVLGASIGSLLGLLTKEFVVLVLIAMAIASPLAWFAMSKWLEEFAYPITITVWMFIAAGIMAIAIAMVTVSFQAVKAALANPVKSLRSE